MYGRSLTIKIQLFEPYAIKSLPLIILINNNQLTAHTVMLA